MSQRTEQMPVDAKEHYRIKPPFPHSRWYYLKELRKLVEFGRDNFVINSNINYKLKLADYGCGTKPYVSLFDSNKIDYLGLDLEWNKHADVIINSNSEIEIESNTFDIVLSTQVLEHVEDPVKYLSEAFRVLKPGGKLLLTTHGYWMYHPDPTDYWRWTSAGLKKIVEKEGFKVIGFKGIIGRMGMGLQLFQDGLLFKVPNFFKPFITAPLQLLVWLFDLLQNRDVVDFDACTYLIVGEKQKG
jgi:SAM-dependent methyltransferase